VSREQARAGDLVFFTGTYETDLLTSHVGIYLGDGMMMHCGDPIQITSIDTPYWQAHLYGFGRIS
jgi:cell wall-associated NlpC family hydrolase